MLTSLRLRCSLMKDLSLFLVKNSLAARMKRGIRSFCHGVGSTSTLNQRKADDSAQSCNAVPSVGRFNMENGNPAASPRTLEEMILQLDLEEEVARRAKVDEYSEFNRRMSCVNNSDILRSARNAALNQYPRFSLDGRDAMYRASFRNFGGGYEGGRRSACCSGGVLGGACKDGYGEDILRRHGLPQTLAGESVVWCKPGVVAKLMGLEAVPVPVSSRQRKRRINAAMTRKQNLRRMGRLELEKERLLTGMHGCRGRVRRDGLGSCSAAPVAGYSVMKPVSTEPVKRREEWRFGRAR